MGFLIDLFKEIPLSGILKERLTEAEAQISAFKLRAENAESKVSELNVRLEQKDAEIKRITEALEKCRRSNQHGGGSPSVGGSQSWMG